MNIQEAIAQKQRADLIRRLGDPNKFIGFMIVMRQEFGDGLRIINALRHPIKDWKEALEEFNGLVERSKAKGELLSEDYLDYKDCFRSIQHVFNLSIEGETRLHTIKYMIEACYSDKDLGEFFLERQDVHTVISESQDNGENWNTQVRLKQGY